MAIKQEPVQRQILTPTSSVQAGNAFAELGAAATDLATSVSKVASDVAIEQAGQQGEADVVAGKAPKTLMPNLTAATKAYNTAVSTTEANRMIESGREQIEQAFIEKSNPATFNADTPALFKAQLTGIMEGTLENARPGTQEQIRKSLSEMSTRASMRMLSHSIEFDNKKTVNDFALDIDNYSRDRKTAAVAGDTKEVERIDLLINETKENYSLQSEQIKSLMPKINKQLQEQKEVDTILGEYAHQTTDAGKAQFMSDLLNNKGKLSFDTLQKASKEILNLSHTEKALKSDINAQEVSIVTDGIKTGRINNADQILNFDNISVPQKLHLMSELQISNAKAAKSNNKILAAQTAILRGRPAVISSSTKDEMFNAAIGNLERDTGNTASLVDMSQSIMGNNNHPASGMPRTPMGANVPAFDSIMSNQLTSGDVNATMTAGLVFNNMVNIDGKPNSVSITGKALAVATLFNTINRGDIAPEEAARLASQQVMQADQPEIKERAERFRTLFSYVDRSTGKTKLDSFYKDTFDTKTRNFKTDSSFSLFKEIFKAHYIDSNSQEAALAATKYDMHSYGTSKYFDEGVVATPVPEKELAITKVGNTFDNQLNIRLQGVIKDNKKMRDNGFNVPVIEWASKDSEINLANLTDESKVFDKLGGSKPKIKIDGHESDVVLIPGLDSMLGQRVRYNYGYYDQFGNLQPLPDASNTAGNVAQFSPAGLEVFAPGVFEEKNQEKLVETAKKIQHESLGNALSAFKDKSNSMLMKNVPVSVMTKLFEMVVGTGDPKKIVNILKQRIQKDSTQKKMVDAETVSVEDNI